MTKPLAIVTGASSGVGLELATLCALEGFDLVVAADEPEIEDANVTGTVRLFTPDEHQAVWSGTTAFIDSFASALRLELADSGVTVTHLVAGSAYAARGERSDGLAGDAEHGYEEFEAMMRGEPDVVGGWRNRLHRARGKHAPASMQAERPRRLPGPASSEASRE